MDFSLTDEQQLLADTARSLFEAEFPSSLLREAVYDPTPDGPHAMAKAFDAHLRGWFALGDESVVDQCLFITEAGAAVLGGPLWSSSALALPVLRAVEAGGASGETADAVAAGELTATVAIAGRDGVWAPNAEPVKCLVPDAGVVDRIVVVRSGHGGEVRVAVVGAGEVQAVPVAALDRSRPLFDVAVGEGPPGEVVDQGALAGALERSTVTLAAELVGVARWLREATVSYVSEREQFGVPVGSFQGLQWKLVDAALAHERAAAAVAYAAMCIDADDPDRHDAVHVAKASAGSAARAWSTEGLQAHGGIGYTWEHDLHLRLRRAYGSDHILGDADWHRDRIADLIF
ncbi:MAG: hypothetical protein GY812_13885 [Actinomycetia bacterium]|nr:hypothetical protein [Actinomycetes bacterium]